MTQFAKNIKEIRLLKKDNQKDFAERLTGRGFAVTWETISRWERGEAAPSICGKKKPNIYVLAEALNVEVGELL